MVFAILVLLPVARAAAQAPEVSITSPGSNSEVSGVVSVWGSASTSDFSFYLVEFGSGASPSAWTPIGGTHNSAVINGQLETWDTTRLASGVYSLRVRAVKTDGNYDEAYARSITVVNDTPPGDPTSPSEATPETTANPDELLETSGAQPTVDGTPTPNETAVPVPTSEPPSNSDGTDPEAAATLDVVAPAEGASFATPTPTPIRVTPNNTLQLDTDGWKQAFLIGAGAMAVIFVVLGILFGLRKLI